MSFCLVIRFGSALFVCVYCAFLFVYISYMFIYMYIFCMFLLVLSLHVLRTVCWLQYSLCVCVCVCIKCVACFTLCSSLVVVVVHVMLLIFMFCPFLLLLLLLLITYVHWCFLCLLTMGDDFCDKVQQLMMSSIRHGCQLCLTCSWNSLSPAL